MFRFVRVNVLLVLAVLGQAVCLPAPQIAMETAVSYTLLRKVTTPYGHVVINLLVSPSDIDASHLKALLREVAQDLNEYKAVTIVVWDDRNAYELLETDFSASVLTPARYREARKHSRAMYAGANALIWTRPGSVWAMDYAVPPVPVDGIYGSILVVRDLGSGKVLAALPVEAETARATTDALRALFVEYPPPLVIKSDNEALFTAAETKELLRASAVIHLLSPPRLPSYNGACEAGIGSLKTRAHHQSARRDHPGEWTCDDVEGARLMANETARRGGFHAPSPDERWRMRLVVSSAERENFRAAVERYRNEVQGGCGYLPGVEPHPASPAAADRTAITRALVAHGFLKLRRRRITLPISCRFASEIS